MKSALNVGTIVSIKRYNDQSFSPEKLKGLI
jgi:hypothetical protein